MKYKTFVLFIFIITIVISCRTPRFVYSPAPPTNPYFREKGESKLAAYYSSAPNENDLEPEDECNHGFDLQAAFAISDNWALTADFFKRKEKDVFFNFNRSLFDSSIVRYDRNSPVSAWVILLH